MSLAAGTLVRLPPTEPDNRGADVWAQPPTTSTGQRLAMFTMWQAMTALVIGTHDDYALVVVDGRLGWVYQGYLTCVE